MLLPREGAKPQDLQRSSYTTAMAHSRAAVFLRRQGRGNSRRCRADVALSLIHI